MKLSFVLSKPALLPFDPETEEWISRQPQGIVLCTDITKARNAKFHRKFMALVRIGFDYFDEHRQSVPVRTSLGMVIPKADFDEFRYWLTVKAGFYYAVAYPDGGVRVRAKSIQFGKMNEDEFQRLYSAVFDLTWQRVLKHSLSRNELEQAVEHRIWSFYG